MKIIAVLLLLAGTALAAPVPKEAHKPPGLAHGVYTIHWSDHPYTATLSGNGDFSEFLTAEGLLWQGRWEWDGDARILSVSESTNGAWYFRWTVKLDAKMSGTTCGGTKVRVEPFRPPQTMPGK